MVIGFKSSLAGMYRKINAYPIIVGLPLDNGFTSWMNWFFNPSLNKQVAMVAVLTCFNFSFLESNMRDEFFFELIRLLYFLIKITYSLIL